MRDLTIAQRWLVRVMSEHQFGRIEDLQVLGGQPVPDQHLRIVRTARLGHTGGGLNAPVMDDPELRKEVRDLFDEIDQLHDGFIDRLEFRHGLPFLLEITVLPQQDEKRTQ
jgi:hypothetical protein